MVRKGIPRFRARQLKEIPTIQWVSGDGNDLELNDGSKMAHLK